MTENAIPKAEQSKAYALFFLAAAIYLCGALAFTAWSFVEHRNFTQSVIPDPHNPAQTRQIGRIAAIEGTESLFLVVMAFPLIALYHRARVRTSQRLKELNARLRRDYDELKLRETELQDAIRDLERFNAAASGREDRIIELKAEVNALLEKMNQPNRYNIAELE